MLSRLNRLDSFCLKGFVSTNRRFVCSTFCRFFVYLRVLPRLCLHDIQSHVFFVFLFPDNNFLRQFSELQSVSENLDRVETLLDVSLSSQIILIYLC